MIFNAIFPCYLFDEVKSGKLVYALDKKTRKVSLVNDLIVEQLVAVMNSAKEEPTRYEFWYEKEKEINENE